MRKTLLLVGAAAGFVVGSKMGTGPYEQLEAKVRKVAERPQVQNAVEQAKNTAKDQFGNVTQIVGDKLPTPSDADTDLDIGEDDDPVVEVGTLDPDAQLDSGVRTN